MLLLCNEDQEYNNPLQVSQPASAGEGSDTCELRKAYRGPRDHDFALMGLSFIYPALPTCLVVYVQKSDFQLINVFRVVIVVKNVLCLVQAAIS